MKKILSLLVIAAALLSCAHDVDPILPENQGGITVWVYGGTETKMTSNLVGDMPGVEEFNENIIKSLDIFFFPAQGLHQSDSDYQNNVQAVHHLFVNNIDAQTTYTAAKDIDEATIKKIFGNNPQAGDQCEVYVIANLDLSSSRFADNATHATLRSSVIDAADFSKVTSETVTVNGVDKIKKTGNLPDRFVMEGWDAITLVHENGIYMVQANVALYRAAAKVKLEVTVPQNVIDDGVEDGNGFVWEPLVDEMEAIMMRGVNRGVVCAADTRYSYTINPSQDYYPNPPSALGENEKLLWNWNNYGHTMENTGTKTKTEGGVTTTIGPKFEHSHPFYSYPTSNWKNDADNEAYMVLMLPWKRKGKTEFHNTYYQIPIVQDWAFDEHRLKSNRYYRMEVTVSIIGSFAATDLTTIVPNSFIVLSWRDDDATDPTEANVNMNHTSFLAVAMNAVEMNNINSASVEYASSHDVTTTVTRIEYMDYSQKQIRKAVITPAQPNRIYYYTKNATTGEYDVYSSYTTSTGVYAKYTADVTTKENFVTLTHVIPDDMYTVQTITVNVSNGVVDDETIVFTQYPPISIEAHQSNGYAFVNRISNGASNTQIFTYNGDWVGTITNRTEAAGETMTGGNTNPNIYSILISSFSDDEFVIGDPRIGTPDNLLYNINTEWSTGCYTFTNHAGFTAQTNNRYWPSRAYLSQNSNSITKRNTDNRTNSYITLPAGLSWDTFDSEANAYGPHTDNNCYWKEGNRYYRAQYRSNTTRYALTGQQGLQNYYPTNPTGTENMIAPEILIASSYGKTTYKSNNYNAKLTLERAAMRCALYQEDGYPAGRWRLPTFAEVKFIMMLSTSEQIPSLFNMTTPTDTEGYWCANGRVILQNNVVMLQNPPGTDPTAPRCVYDLWYWGDKDDPTSSYDTSWETTWHLGDND